MNPRFAKFLEPGPAGSDQSERLRILMICPQYRPIVGGYEQASERLSHALALRGHKVSVVTERRRKAWPAHEVSEGVQVRRLWCVYRPNLHLLTALVSLAIFLLVHGRRFGVWHVHQYGLHGALAVAVGKLVGRPVVLKLTSSGDHGISGAVAKGRVPSVVAALLRRVAAVAAPTRETVREAESFGIPAARIHRLGNGVDTSLFRPSSDKSSAALKRRLGLEGRCVVLYVGRLSAEKNPDGLLRAWELVRPLIPSKWVLAIVGDGPMRKQLEAFISSRDLEGNVLLVGQQSSIDEWTRASEIYVSPSNWEGLSNTLLEAMASGLPSVTTRVSGATELVRETDSGIVVDVGDISGLAQALVKLAKDADLRGKCGESARLAIERDYSIEAVAQKHEALYRQLIAEGG